MPTIKNKNTPSSNAITRVDNPAKYAPFATVMKQNQLLIAMKLLHASEVIDQFSSDTKHVIDKLDKKLRRKLTTIIDIFVNSVGESLKRDIIPNTNTCGSASYVLNRI